MPKPPDRSKPDNPEQLKRFVDLATEFGVEATPAEFERAFLKVATAPRKAPKPKKSKSAKR